MDIIFYNTSSEKNKLNKTLTNEDEFEGVLRGGTSIKNPIIRVVATSDIIAHNYAYIEEFGRYYFITDCVSVRDGVWDISMRCDVLMSFRSAILNTPIILDNSENTNISTYLSSPIFRTLVKDKTDIINFPSGLPSSGEYILITAGG